MEAMEAVRLLRAEPAFRDAKLLIAGSGSERANIEKWIAEHGHGQDGIHLVGPLHGAVKTKFLGDADAILFPASYREALPYSILESLAAGTPVITTPVGGIVDVVKDRQHGRLVAVRDPQQIVRPSGKWLNRLRGCSGCRDNAACVPSMSMDWSD